MTPRGLRSAGRAGEGRHHKLLEGTMPGPGRGEIISGEWGVVVLPPPLHRTAVKRAFLGKWREAGREEKALTRRSTVAAG